MVLKDLIAGMARTYSCKTFCWNFSLKQPVVIGIGFNSNFFHASVFMVQNSFIGLCRPWLFTRSSLNRGSFFLHFWPARFFFCVCTRLRDEKQVYWTIFRGKYFVPVLSKDLDVLEKCSKFLTLSGSLLQFPWI